MGRLGRAADRLGRTLADGFRSRDGLRALPGELRLLAGEGWRRLRHGQPLGARELESMGALDVAEVVQRLQAGRRAASWRAAALAQLSSACREADAARAAELARAAWQADRQPQHAVALAARLWDVGALREPAAILSALREADLCATDRRRRDDIAALLELERQLPQWTAADAPAAAPIPGADVLLYVAAMALPYTVSGYATRTQALVRALQAAGREVTVLTRPGYPWDRHDIRGLPTGDETYVDGVIYRHLRQPSRAQPLTAYFRRAADAIKAQAQRVGATQLQAASNAENALPALIAARELGLPFTFEMRGLWELTRAAGVSGYEGSERFRVQMALERHCALHADRVCVISREVGRQAVAWGVAPACIAELPNCIGELPPLPAHSPSWPDTLKLAYAGSVLPYEGLALLVEAIAQLRADGLAITLEVAGDGKALPALREQVRRARLQGAIVLHGRMPPAAATALLARCDAVALPRLPLAVCRSVPPIKLVEAMALAKAVVVPDLPAFADEVDDGVEGLAFAAGQVAALAGALRRLAVDPALRLRLGAAARARVAATRTWARFAADVPR